MDELSLYVLDITMNSVRAGATEIRIELLEEGDKLTFKVSDNGCGMTEEQLKRLSDPFFTTRKTRKVGLGIPFLKMLAEMTGGGVEITSAHESTSADHGTTTIASFYKNHIDFIPLGNMVETVKTFSCSEILWGTWPKSRCQTVWVGSSVHAPFSTRRTSGNIKETRRSRCSQITMCRSFCRTKAG